MESGQLCIDLLHTCCRDLSAAVGFLFLRDRVTMPKTLTAVEGALCDVATTDLLA